MAMNMDVSRNDRRDDNKDSGDVDVTLDDNDDLGGQDNDENNDNEEDTQAHLVDKDDIESSVENSADEDVDNRNDVVDKGYAWVVMIAVFSIHFLLIGYVKTGGIYFYEWQREFHSTASMTSLVVGLAEGFFSITSPFIMGYLINILSVRQISILATSLMVTGVIGNAVCTRIEYLILTHSFCFGVAKTAILGPSFVMINSYFEKRRPLATSIAVTGSSFGGVVFPLIARTVFDSYGYMGGSLMTAGVLLHICIGSSLLTPIETTIRFSNKKRICKQVVRRGRNGNQQPSSLLQRNSTNDELELKDCRSDKNIELVLSTENEDDMKNEIDYLEGAKVYINKHHGSQVMQNGAGMMKNGVSIQQSVSQDCVKEQSVVVQNVEEIEEMGDNNKINKDRREIVENGCCKNTEIDNLSMNNQFEFSKGDNASIGDKFENHQIKHAACSNYEYHFHNDTQSECLLTSKEGNDNNNFSDCKMELLKNDNKQCDGVDSNIITSLSTSLISLQSCSTLNNLPLNMIILTNKTKNGDQEFKQDESPKRSPSSHENRTQILKSINEKDKKSSNLSRLKKSNKNHSSLSSSSSFSINKSSSQKNSCFIKNCKPSSQKNNTESKKKLFRIASFWVLLPFYFCGAVGIGVTNVYIIPLAKEKGLTDKEAAFCMSIQNVLDIASRLIPGIILSKFKISSTSLAIVPLGIVGIMGQLTFVFDSYESFLGLSVIYGLCMGFFYSMLSLFVIDTLGVENFASATGIYFLVIGVAGVVSYPIGGALKDLTGTYGTTFHYLGATMLCGVAILIALPFVKRHDVRRGLLKADN